MKARTRRYDPTRRRKGIVTFGLLGLLMLLSHQNCAPAGNVATHSSSAGISLEVPIPVTMIDESKKVAGLSFPYGEVEVTGDSDTVTLFGNCSDLQEGAIFGWKLNEMAVDGSLGVLVAQGQTTCSSRQFAIQASASSLVCDHVYKAVAQLGFGQPGEVVIHKPCKPE